MAATKTIRPLTERERVDLVDFLGWTPEGPLRFSHPERDLTVEYRTGLYGWMARAGDETAGPFSTVWAALDHLAEG